MRLGSHRSQHPMVAALTAVTVTSAAVLVLLWSLSAGATTGQPAGGALRAAAAAATGGTAPSFQSAATLTGPVSTGHVVEPLTAQSSDLAQYGYVEQEYFARGTATSFT